MSNLFHTAAVLPNRESATRCSASVVVRAVMRVAHKVFLHDTRAQLLDITKASPRTVAYWMSRRAPNMTVENLVALMRAAPADFVPVVLGEDAYQALAREIIRQATIEDLRKRQEEQRQLIERLEREAAE